MSEHQYVFEVRELATLSSKCEHCGTVVVFSMETDDRFGTPKRCSTCQEPLGAAAQAFVDYRAFYRSAMQSKARMRLHAVASEKGE